MTKRRSGSGFDSWDMPGGGRVNFRDNDEGAQVCKSFESICKGQPVTKGDFGMRIIRGIIFSLALMRSGVRFTGEPSSSKESWKG